MARGNQEEVGAKSRSYLITLTAFDANIVRIYITTVPVSAADNDHLCPEGRGPSHHRGPMTARYISSFKLSTRLSAPSAVIHAQILKCAI